MRHLAVGLFLLLAANVWASIGTVAETKGTACNIERNKAKVSGATGSAIESLDTYTTGTCSGKIKFQDDTQVQVNENSRLLIDDFVFDPKKSDAGKLAIKVSMGTVRYASGQISKNNPQQVSIKTPTASIAVRGTDFSMTVDESGQSLVILVPSCKDPNDVKQYELEENRCTVGSIEVSTSAGTVTLDQAFQGTYVISNTMMPTVPRVINIVESKINNTLIIAKPIEIQRAIKDVTGRTKNEKEAQELEAAAAALYAQAKKDAEQAEGDRILKITDDAARSGCNARTSVCVSWQRPSESDIQSRGKGTAFRLSDNEHYAEVKTEGYSSNTTVMISHNNESAGIVIGDGSAGGNLVFIKQRTGTVRIK